MAESQSGAQAGSGGQAMADSPGGVQVQGDLIINHNYFRDIVKDQTGEPPDPEVERWVEKNPDTLSRERLEAEYRSLVIVYATDQHGVPIANLGETISIDTQNVRVLGVEDGRAVVALPDIVDSKRESVFVHGRMILPIGTRRPFATLGGVQFSIEVLAAGQGGALAIIGAVNPKPEAAPAPS
jgi:hypothetical protein